jgi:hypothetical protein
MPRIPSPLPALLWLPVTAGERGSLMKHLRMPATVLAIFAGAVLARADGVTQVTLRIDGVHNDEDGVAIAAALSRIPNIKLATRPTAQNPTVIIAPLERAGYDLGDLARAVAGTQTPNRAKGTPSAALVFTYQEYVGGAAAPLVRDLQTTCARLAGVDAKKCRFDVQKQEFQIKLDDHGGARQADIQAVFPGLSTEYYPKR